MMSGSSSSDAAGVGLRMAPFTAVQWEELEQQALIYKYLMAGLPVPPDLVVPIRRSLEALSTRFFHHPSLGVGYCSYYGKKFDPEPGRCRRTDGKKWRCSKDAYPDSKYCERHMNRGRSRSRKPVESQSTSQSLSTAMLHIPTGSSNGGGSFQSSGSSGSFQNLTFPVGSSESVCYGSNALKLQMEQSSPYGINQMEQSSPYGINKDYRYLQGLAPDADEHKFSQENLSSKRGLGMENNIDNTWRLKPSQFHSSTLSKPRSDFNLQGKSTQPNLAQAYELNAATSKQRHQHCFFGNNVASPTPMKQEQHLMHPFLDEWPKTRESWSDLDNHKNAFSTTRLSISTPMDPPEYSSRSGCSRSPDNGLVQPMTGYVIKLSKPDLTKSTDNY